MNDGDDANCGWPVWASPVTSLIDLLTQQNLFLFLAYDVILSILIV